MCASRRAPMEACKKLQRPLGDTSWHDRRHRGLFAQLHRWIFAGTGSVGGRTSLQLFSKRTTRAGLFPSVRQSGKLCFFVRCLAKRFLEGKPRMAWWARRQSFVHYWPASSVSWQRAQIAINSFCSWMLSTCSLLSSRTHFPEQLSECSTASKVLKLRSTET